MQMSEILILKPLKQCTNLNYSNTYCVHVLGDKLPFFKYYLLTNPQGSRKRGRPKTSWRSSFTKEVVEAGMNYGSWRLIDRSGKNS